GIGSSFGLAFAKAQLAAGQRLPISGTTFLSVNDRDKAALLPLARQLAAQGFSLVATRGTAEFLEAKSLNVVRVFKVNEGRPNVVDLIKSGMIQLVINTPLGRKSFYDERAIRRAAIRHQVTCLTTLEAATAAVTGIEALQKHKVEIRSLQDLHQRFQLPELGLPTVGEAAGAQGAPKEITPSRKGTP
ncbi:MAG: hypothetical protein ACE1Z8_10415, partial [Candidatus Acidiferrales bacterium]